MQMDITAEDLSLTDSLRAHIERRIRSAVGRCAPRVRTVRIRCSDINGPRGGADKQCKIRATLAPRGELVITDSDRDLYATINRSASRLKYAVSRHVNYWPKNRRRARP